MTAGVADTMLAIPSRGYHGAFLEFKQERIEYKGGRKTTSRGYQSPAQKAFQAVVEAQGYKYTIIRNIEEFTAFMGEYLGTDDTDRRIEHTR